jgi:hypothetical protein
MLHCDSGSERNDTHHNIRDTMFVYIWREAVLRLCLVKSNRTLDSYL